MILWAIIACAVVGFVLGTQCRLVPLALASGLVAGCSILLPPAGEAALLTGALTVLGLLVVLQAFFLAGAVVGLRPRRSPRPSPVPRLASLADNRPCGRDGEPSSGHRRLIR